MNREQTHMTITGPFQIEVSETLPGSVVVMFCFLTSSLDRRRPRFVRRSLLLLSQTRYRFSPPCVHSSENAIEAKRKRLLFRC